MLGLLMAGLVCAVAFGIATVTFMEPYKELYLNGEKKAVRELPRFSYLVLRTKGYIDYFEPFERAVVRESDSVTAPVLTAPADIISSYVCETKGDTLNLVLDYDILMKDAPKEGPRRPKGVYIGEEGVMEVTVPRGMMRGVKSKVGPLCIDGFRASFLKTEINRRVTLTDCQLDTFRCTSGSIERLEVYDSSIDFASIRQPRNHLKVETFGDNCFITRMEVSGDKRNNSQIYLPEARVGSLDWVPTDSAARLEVTLSSPASITMR